MLTRPIAAWLPSAVLPVHAASGSIDSFSAGSTTVRAGESVEFQASFSIVTTGWTQGGSDPVEPAPQEGSQFWTRNWYSTEHETVTRVWLQAGSQNFSDAPALSPGSSYGGSWSFTLSFPTPGQYQVEVSGGFDYGYEAYSDSENASRNCTNVDPEGGGALQCDSWTYSYPEYTDRYSSSGSLGPALLSIEVLPAVPELPTAAMWLAAAGLLALRRSPARGRVFGVLP